MNHFDQVHQLYELIKFSKYPVSKKRIAEELEVSLSTAKNRIAEMRDRYDAPLEYKNKDNGYIFTDDKYELHGIWFSQNELHAFLMIEQQMELLEPGLISNQLKTAKQKIIKLLQDKTKQIESPSQRLRILSIHNKKIESNTFNQVAEATLKRKQLKITYQAHANQKISKRTISPQRMVFYKYNWYIDAWCHNKKAIRTFAIDAILESQTIHKKAKEIEPKKLQEKTSTTYGIFSGKQKNKATINFTTPNAHWISKEKWHSQQRGKWLNKTNYQLIIPYDKDEELIMDILKHGEKAKILAPQKLKDKIKQKIKKMKNNY